VDALSGQENESAMARTKRATLADYQRQYRGLQVELTEIGLIRSGSLAPRYNYCGNPNCRCHGDPPQPHGPYFQWTAKVDGKTVNRRLNARQAELYREWIANDRRLHAIINQMREVAAKATDLILEGSPQS
jgi:Family of unknown function (DUF6788)